MVEESDHQVRRGGTKAGHGRVTWKRPRKLCRRRRVQDCRHWRRSSGSWREPQGFEVAEERPSRGRRSTRADQDSMEQLKTAEVRAEYGEKTVQKLNLRLTPSLPNWCFEKMKTRRMSMMKS